MVSSYDLNSFYTILKKGFPCILDEHVLTVIKSIDTQIVPILVEPKKIDLKKKKYRPPGPEKWDEKNTFKSQMPIIVEKSGVDKWLQDIRTGLNKMSIKNYDSQMTEIIQCLGNCMEAETLTDLQKKDNLKTIATFIFNIASTNKFYAEMYAKLYKELMNVNIVFQEILLAHVASYANSVKDIQYFNPENDYERYCVNNKVNDARKATAVFLVNLMKEDVLQVTRVLNIIVSFQTLLMEYIDQEEKTNEVDEITEILFLLIKEGKSTYDVCQGEYIWKFVIKQNIDILSKYSKKDKKSLSSRAIFKYIDMAALIK
jgi:hypothetical protein